MRTLAQRLKRQKYRKAAPFTPVPVLLKVLILFSVASLVFFGASYGYWQNQYYGQGRYSFPADPFTNVWNGQVQNYTVTAAPAFDKAVTGTVGFGTSLSPSATSGGPATGTDTGHLSFSSPAAVGAGILVYAYSQTPQSYYINDTTQNAGPGNLFGWFGNSGANQRDGKLGVCYIATATGMLMGMSFLIENPGGGAATGTVQGQLYSTTGNQNLTTAFGNPAGHCASKSVFMENSTNTVNMSAISTSTQTLVTFNFNSSMIQKGAEYIVVAHMLFTNAVTAQLQFEEMNGTWFGLSAQGPYCQSTFAAGIVVPPSYPPCHYSSVDNAGASAQGALNAPANDNDQFACVGLNGCIWFNVAVDPQNSVTDCVSSCYAVSDSRGNSYSFDACVSLSNIQECVFHTLNGQAGTVAWVDVAASTSSYYSVLAVSYANVFRFGSVLSNSTSCSGSCSSVLLSPFVGMPPTSLVVASYQTWAPDPNGFEVNPLSPFQTFRAGDGNNAGFGNGQCDGYTPCGSNIVNEATSAQVYCTSGGLCTSGKVNFRPACLSGVGACVLGQQVLGLWVVLYDNRCPSGWQCFLSGVQTGGVGGHAGIYNGYFGLNSNLASASVALSNDSYTLSTAVGKPLALLEQMNGGINARPWGWYLTTNGTLTASPNYSPLLDPGVYLAFMAYPQHTGNSTFANGVINYYVYMRHTSDRQSLLAAGGGVQDPFPICSPNSNVFLCGQNRSGMLGGLMSMLLNFTGSTEGGTGAANCVPGGGQPCGQSFMCLNSNATITATTCNISGDYNTGLVNSLLSFTGQVNYTRIFPWLDIQSQRFYSGFWSSRGEDTVNFLVHKWVSNDPVCTTPGTSISCRFNVFHLIFPASGSCVLVSGSVPCNTQETGFIGWLGGLFTNTANFLGLGFLTPLINPFLQFGNSLLGALVNGVTQAFIYMAIQLRGLLNSISTIWGDGHLGDNVFLLLQGTIATLNQILGGFATFALWIFNFVFIVVPFLVGNFVTLIVSVSASVYVIVLTLIPLIVAFGGLINMPLQSLFFFDYVYGLAEVLFFGLPGWMSWIRFNIWLFTMAWQIFDYFISKTIWTVRSLKQLIPVIG